MRYFLIIIFFAFSILEATGQKSPIVKIVINLSKIISEIGFYETVDDNFVGYSGIQSNQYNRFVILKMNATDSELVKLTKSFYSNVKAYAYWALVGRNSPLIKDILKEHLSDKQAFILFSGCLRERKYINQWFFDLSKDHLSSSEIAEYKKYLN